MTGHGLPVANSFCRAPLLALGYFSLSFARRKAFDSFPWTSAIWRVIHKVSTGKLYSFDFVSGFKAFSDDWFAFHFRKYMFPNIAFHSISQCKSPLYWRHNYRRAAEKPWITSPAAGPRKWIPNICWSPSLKQTTCRVENIHTQLSSYHAQFQHVFLHRT